MFEGPIIVTVHPVVIVCRVIAGGAVTLGFRVHPHNTVPRNGLGVFGMLLTLILWCKIQPFHTAFEYACAISQIHPNLLRVDFSGGTAAAVFMGALFDLQPAG